MIVQIAITGPDREGDWLLVALSHDGRIWQRWSCDVEWRSVSEPPDEAGK